MKNIVIMGSARAGKSTLANKIAEKLPFQIIHVDSLRDTFYKIYPELGVGVDTAIKNERFQEFLVSYLSSVCFESKGKFGYILEGLELSLETIKRNLLNPDYLIYGLGISNTTVDQFVLKMQENDNEYEWTYQKPLEDLKQIAQEYIDLSNKIKEFCEQYQIPYYDTVENREIILNQIVLEISERYED
jgi:adenylate kinase family enzyme